MYNDNDKDNDYSDSDDDDNDNKYSKKFSNSIPVGPSHLFIIIVTGFLEGDSQDLKIGRPKLCYRTCSNKQFIRQCTKNKTVFFKNGYLQDIWILKA